MKLETRFKAQQRRWEVVVDGATSTSGFSAITEDKSSLLMWCALSGHLRLLVGLYRSESYTPSSDES